MITSCQYLLNVNQYFMRDFPLRYWQSPPCLHFSQLRFQVYEKDVQPTNAYTKIIQG